MSKRIIIHRYSPSCAGIGDFLRAAGSLRQYCISHDIEFYLDITNPIGQFFTYSSYEGDVSTFYDVPELRDGYRPDNDLIYKEVLYQDANAIILTNIVIDWTNLDKYVYELRDILHPNPIITEKYNDLMITNGLQPNKYICIHIRFGDNALRGTNWDDRVGRSNKSVEKRLVMCLDSINNKELPIVLITDNYEAKIKLSAKYYLRYLDIKPVHTSFTTDTDAVEQTILEFITISEAAEVFAVSRSGFSHWAAAYGGKLCRCMQ